MATRRRGGQRQRPPPKPGALAAAAASVRPSSSRSRSRGGSASARSSAGGGARKRSSPPLGEQEASALLERAKSEAVTERGAAAASRRPVSQSPEEAYPPPASTAPAQPAATPPEQPRPVTAPPTSGRRSVSGSSVGTAASSVSGRGYRRGADVQSMGAKAESITSLPWAGACRSLSDVYLSSFLRVRDEQGRFLLCRSSSDSPLLEPAGVTAFPNSRVASVLNAVERVATERGVQPPAQSELFSRLKGTELGTLGKVVLPVPLRSTTWDDLRAIDPLFEACRIPRKARQTGHDDQDSAAARALLMKELVTDLRVLTAAELGRGMATVQREGFACALLPAVGYGVKKTAPENEHFDIWIGRVCEVTLSDRCVQQLTERDGDGIYFATPGEIARRRSDGSGKSKRGRWRISRGSALLLQRPEVSGGISLSKMLAHFCQSDLAARIAQPEVYAKDWYVKRIPGRGADPLLPVAEYEPEPEPEPEQDLVANQQARHSSSARPVKTNRQAPSLVAEMELPDEYSTGPSVATGSSEMGQASSLAAGDPAARESAERQALPQVAAVHGQPVAATRVEQGQHQQTKQRRRPSPPAGPPPLGGWTEGSHQSNASGAVADEHLWAGAHGGQLAGVQSPNAELLRETNEQIFRSAAESEAARVAATKAVAQAEAKTAAAEAEAQRHAQAVEKLERELHGVGWQDGLSQHPHQPYGALSSRDAEIARIRGRVQDMVQADKQLSHRLSTEFQRQRSENSQNEQEIIHLHAKVQQLETENSQLRAASDAPSEVGSESTKQMQRREEELRQQLDIANSKYTQEHRKMRGRTIAEQVVAKFHGQILDEISRRQEQGDTVDIVAIFESFDTDGDGTLSHKELLVGLREFGIKMSKKESKELLAVLDGDGDGTVDWHEFAGVIEQAQEDARKRLEEQLEDANKAQAIEHLKEKLALVENESIAKASELAELRKLVNQKNENIAGLENRLVESGEMHESERAKLESARELEVAKSAEQQKMSEEAARMAEVHAVERQRMAEEYDKVQVQMQERAQATAKRFVNMMTNKALSDAFAKLKAHTQQRLRLNAKWAEFVEYQQSKLAIKLRKELARKRREKSQEREKHYTAELEKAKQIAADLKKKQLLQVDHGHDDELRYETLLDKYERADAELKEMQEKYGVLETTQNRRLNSSKAAQEVIAQFSTQIMEEIASRQQDGDTVDLNAIFESFDTDGDGTLSQKELMVGLREFGIKLSKDERKKLLDILDADGDGTIDWQEFAGVIQQMQDNAMHELERHKLEDDKKELADKHQLMVDQLSKLEDESLGHASQVQNRKMNSSKAAQEVASQFNRQILEEVQRRQKDGDDVDIKTVFESFDTDGNGVLTRKELVVGLREFGIKMSKDEKEKLLEILDENGDDQIDWQEFAAVIKHSLENAKKQLDKELEDAKKQEIQAQLVDLRGKLAQAKKEAAAKDEELQLLRAEKQRTGRGADGRKSRSQQLLDIEGRSDSEDPGIESEGGASDEDSEAVPNPKASQAAQKLRQKEKAKRKQEKAEAARKKQEAEEKAQAQEQAAQAATMKAILNIGFDKAPDGSAIMDPSLLHELAENGLEKLQPGLIRLGYLLASDLADADEDEIDSLASELGLKEPEKRRLIKTIPDATARAEEAAQRKEEQRKKQEEEEAVKAQENEQKLAELKKEAGEDDSDDEHDSEHGGAVDFQSAHFKRIALMNRMKAMKLEKLHDIVTKAGYLFVSDLQEAGPDERASLSQMLNLRPPEHRRWEELVGGEWVTKTIRTEKVQVEIDPNTLTFRQLLERQGLERLEEQLKARGYHNVVDFQLEDEDEQEAELVALMSEFELKPPEIRRLRKVLEQEEEPDGTLKQALEEISLGRLHAPLSSKGYASPADLVEADKQELALVIKNAKLSAPQLRRWLQMLEDQGWEPKPLPGLQGSQPPEALLGQAFAAQRLEGYQDKLREMGYLSATDLQALMEEADNFKEEELASVVKALDLKQPEARRLQAMAEGLEDLAEMETDANAYPEDEEELAAVALESALQIHNLTRLGPSLRDEGYETVGDLMEAEEEELGAVIMRRRLNNPEFRRWQRLLGKDEEDDPTNYSPPRTFRKALALQLLDHLSDPLTQQGYLALGDLVAAVDNPGELASLHRTLGLKPPEQRRLQIVIDEAEDDEDADPIEVEAEEPLDTALRRLGLERLAEKLAAEGYTTAGDLRSAGPEDLDYTQELKSLVEGFHLSPPEWRRWQVIANPDDPQDPPLMLGQALAVQNLAQHEAQLGRLGYNSVADLSGVEGSELEGLVAKLALRPPERRRLELIIAEADGYEDIEDGRPDEELPLQQTLVAQSLGHLCEPITALGYISVGDLTEASDDEIAALLRSLNLQPPEARRLRKAIRRDEPDPPPPPDNPLARTLRLGNVGLEHLALPLAEQGFLSIADLLEADAQELGAALGELQLKPPEHRRLHRLIDTAAAGGESLQTSTDGAAAGGPQDPAAALVATLQKQNLERLVQPLAEHGYLGARDLAEADVAELAAVISKLALQPAEERRLKKALGTGKSRG